MKYIDTVQLATTTNDGYGDQTVTVLTQAKAVFIQRTAVGHDNNADGIVSDAAVYLDPTNAVVTANVYRLEGMYIAANPLGGSQTQSWYRITHVTVGQRKLLNNAIDNVYCLLEKEAGAPYVTYVS
jgi:hypothetical protein